MTALIYKAALPTYTSLADLNANAGESLLLNDAGTAYELEPAQSGATVLAAKRAYMYQSSVVVHTASYTYMPVGGGYQGDAGIFDLTDPADWVAVESGVYTVTAGFIRSGAGLPAEMVLFGLEMDTDTLDTGPSGLFSLADPNGDQAQQSVTGTLYVPAGSSIKAFLRHAHGSDLSFNFSAVVTFIPATAP